MSLYALYRYDMSLYDAVYRYRLNSIKEKKCFFGHIPYASGVMQVARGGSGAKAPPFAARPVDTSPISRWPSRPIWDEIPTTILQSWFATIPSLHTCLLVSWPKNVDPSQVHVFIHTVTSRLSTSL